jgi:hypothetical protein
MVMHISFFFTFFHVSKSSFQYVNWRCIHCLTCCSCWCQQLRVLLTSFFFVFCVTFVLRVACLIYVAFLRCLFFLSLSSLFLISCLVLFCVYFLPMSDMNASRGKRH